jgi:hypothetical protein
VDTFSQLTLITRSLARRNFARLGVISLVLGALALTACGGSDSSPTTNVNPPPNNGGGDETFVYKGVNPAASPDVLKFQARLWVNIAPENRCGSCHGTGGQQPTFTRADDINLAYSAIIDNGLVDLANPSQSRLVTKVAGGHNCWQGDPVACSDIITTWIASWAENSGTQTNSIILTPPEEKDVSNSKSFPDSPEAFTTTVYPLLTQYCGSCHAEGAVTRQQPYFGSMDVNVAYIAARSRMRLDNPAASRFVQRLRTDFHNCWGNDCTASANTMQAAIQAFADTIPETVIDESLIMSKAVGLGDAFVVTSGGRVDTDLIAKYEFKTGTGTIAYDTSGVEPSANLNLVGNVGWSSAWGIRIGSNGKAQATTGNSRKIYNLIRGAGEYSIETWVIPDSVAQGENDSDPARIVSLSGSATERNFTLGQYDSNYSFLNRTNRSDANGLAELATDPDDERVQATLQHVVATFDPINGRRIYVNGEFTSDIDPEIGAVLADWDNSYALVVGNEVSSNRLWQGSVRFLGIHDRAMSAGDIVKNFEVGVGARYLLLFNVSELINVPFSFIVFELQQFDDYGYLFNQPFFTILPDPATGTTATLGSNVQIEGIRIGINGSEVLVGQVFANLDTVISAGSMVDGRQVLSNLGTVLEAKRGPELDEFFLTFDRIGSQSYARPEAPVPQPVAPSDLEGQAAIGLRTFAEIDATLSFLTTVPRTTPAVANTYNNVQQQLPTVPNLEGFLAAHQMGITQLTVSYCNALASDSARRASFFPGFNFSAGTGTAFNSAGRALIIEPLLVKLLAHEIGGTKLVVQADPDELRLELNQLINRMTAGSAPTPDVVMATCAAAFGGAVMLLQ